MPCQRSEAITNGDCLSESIHPACRVAARKEFSFFCEITIISARQLFGGTDIVAVLHCITVF